MKKPIKHYTAGVFIFTDSLPTKVLLVHHKKLGVWLEPGGHQEEDENPIETAIREVNEETGLDISPYIGQVNAIDALAGYIPRPQYFLEEKIAKRGKEPEHYHLDQIYVVRIPEQTVKLKRRESHDLRWFFADELANLPLIETIRPLLNQEMSQS